MLPPALFMLLLSVWRVSKTPHGDMLRSAMRWSAAVDVRAAFVRVLSVMERCVELAEQSVMAAPPSVSHSAMPASPPRESACGGTWGSCNALAQVCLRQGVRRTPRSPRRVRSTRRSGPSTTRRAPASGVASRPGARRARVSAMGRMRLLRACEQHACGVDAASSEHIKLAHVVCVFA